MDFFVFQSWDYKKHTFGENTCQEIVRKAMQWSMRVNKNWHSLPGIIYSKLSSVPRISVFVSYHSKYFFFNWVVKIQVIMYFSETGESIFFSNSHQCLCNSSCPAVWATRGSVHSMLHVSTLGHQRHPFEDILFGSLMPDLLSHFIIGFASEILDALNLIRFACVSKSLKVDRTPWSLDYLRCTSCNTCVQERGSWSFHMHRNDYKWWKPCSVGHVSYFLTFLCPLLSVIPSFSRRTLYQEGNRGGRAEWSDCWVLTAGARLRVCFPAYYMRGSCQLDS